MIEMYKKAGKIVAKVRGKAFNQVKIDLKVLELAEFVEDEIMALGGMPAFPCNISVNEITAHYTPPLNDETTLKYGDVVKIDIGAQVDGYIADTAVTVLVEEDENVGSNNSPQNSESFMKHLKMIETAENALENAINTIRSGVELGKIGEVIEDTITKNGFNSVVNLTGHSMDRWILHSGLSIPNIKEKNPHKIEEGDVLALEPFVTEGVGRVVDTKQAYIFRFLRDRPLRMIQARKLIEIIKKDYKNLPFAERWLEKYFNGHQLNMAMRQLISSRAVYPYHVLKEKSNSTVAQAEHTVIVEKDGCMIITE